MPHLGVLRVQGADAAAFLHGQLTQDFVLLGQDKARLAALCSPKGRVLASFIGFKRTPEDILLLCSQDLLATTMKRLSMFVLRARVKISDASADFKVQGLAGALVHEWAPQLQQPWDLVQTGGASVLALYPAQGVARALRVAGVEEAAVAAPAITLDQWLLAEVRSGVATVQAALSDTLLPQMLNYESVGGVSFKKGCYPGQEVVARSQFRGTLKRRLFLARASGALAAGQEIFSRADPEQPVGQVVQLAPLGAGACEALVCLQVASAQDTTLHAAGAEGVALTILELPYALLQDI